MKKCITCNNEKPIEEFYRHNKMKDGFLNKCKTCCKTQSKELYHTLFKNKEWREKERKRVRERYIRLNYKENKKKPSKESKVLYNKNWEDKYPEKKRANQLSQHVVVPDGLNKHHWSYCEGFEKNVFFLSVPQHKAIHRNMIYDQEQKMYRTLSGKLLDTKDIALEYYNEVFKKEVVF